MKNTLIIFALFFVLLLFYSCEKVETPVATNEDATLQKVNVVVTDVEQLYAAVNDPANSWQV